MCATIMKDVKSTGEKDPEMDMSNCLQYFTLGTSSGDSGFLIYTCYTYFLCTICARHFLLRKIKKCCTLLSQKLISHSRSLDFPATRPSRGQLLGRSRPSELLLTPPFHKGIAIRRSPRSINVKISFWCD